MIPEQLYHYTKGENAFSIISGGNKKGKEICFWLKNAGQKNDKEELLLGQELVIGLKRYMRAHNRSSIINEVVIEPSLVYINSFTENGFPHEDMLKEYGRFRLEFNLRDYRFDGDIGECTYFGADDVDRIVEYYQELFDKNWSLVSQNSDTIALGNYVLWEASAFVSIPFLKHRERWSDELEWRHVLYQQNSDERVFIHDDGFPRMRSFYPATALIGITCFSDEEHLSEDLSYYHSIQDWINNHGWQTEVRLMLKKTS